MGPWDGATLKLPAVDQGRAGARRMGAGRGAKTVSTCSFFRGLSMAGIDKGHRRVRSSGLRQGEVKDTGRAGEEDPGVGK